MTWVQLESRVKIFQSELVLSIVKAPKDQEGTQAPPEPKAVNSKLTYSSSQSDSGVTWLN